MAHGEWTGDPTYLLQVGPGFRLADVDPDSTPGYTGGRAAAQKDLQRGVPELAELQERLFAASTREGIDRVLLVLQAQDTAGKGGILRHVVGAVDPQGVRLAAFKKPTPQESEHDFLWRVSSRTPGPGIIGVFDRSHYEDVLIQRVRGMAPPEEIERRYGAIVEFEKGLAAIGTRIIKVMLRISRDEQRKRLLERLDRPEKHWKFEVGDIDERERWDQYDEAYQIVFDRTSIPQAPWYVVPANKKWYARLAVQRLLIDTLRRIDPQWPPADFDVEEQRARLG